MPLQTDIKNNCLSDVKSQLTDNPEIINQPFNAKGVSPLMQAVYFGHESMIRLLLKYGANPLLKDNTGFTAKDYTSSKDIQRLLSLFENDASDNDPASLHSLQTKFEALVRTATPSIRTFLDNLLRGITEEQTKGRTKQQITLDYKLCLLEIYFLFQQDIPLETRQEKARAFFAKRATLLQGSAYDYLFLDSTPNTLCLALAKLLFPGSDPFHILYEDALTLPYEEPQSDAMQRLLEQAPRVHNKAIQWSDFILDAEKELDFFYFETLEAGSEIKRIYFRDHSNNIHRLDSLIESVIEKLKSADYTDEIWQGNDTRINNGLLNEKDLAVLSRLPALKTLIDYQRFAKTKTTSQITLAKLKALEKGLRDGDAYNNGSEYIAGDPANIAIADFAVWWNALDPTEQKKLKTLSGQVYSLENVLDIILSEGDLTNRDATRYCVNIKADQLASILRDSRTQRILFELLNQATLKTKAELDTLEKTAKSALNVPLDADLVMTHLFSISVPHEALLSFYLDNKILFGQFDYQYFYQVQKECHTLWLAALNGNHELIKALENTQSPLAICFFLSKQSAKEGQDIPRELAKYKARKLLDGNVIPDALKPSHGIDEDTLFQKAFDLKSHAFIAMLANKERLLGRCHTIEKDDISNQYPNTLPDYVFTGAYYDAYLAERNRWVAVKIESVSSTTITYSRPTYYDGQYIWQGKYTIPSNQISSTLKPISSKQSQCNLSFMQRYMFGKNIKTNYDSVIDYAFLHDDKALITLIAKHDVPISIDYLIKATESNIETYLLALIQENTLHTHIDLFNHVCKHLLKQEHNLLLETVFSHPQVLQHIDVDTQYDMLLYARRTQNDTLLKAVLDSGKVEDESRVLRQSCLNFSWDYIFVLYEEGRLTRPMINRLFKRASQEKNGKALAFIYQTYLKEGKHLYLDNTQLNAGDKLTITHKKTDHTLRGFLVLKTPDFLVLSKTEFGEATDIVKLKKIKSCEPHILSDVDFNALPLLKIALEANEPNLLELTEVTDETLLNVYTTQHQTITAYIAKHGIEGIPNITLRKLLFYAISNEKSALLKILLDHRVNLESIRTAHNPMKEGDEFQIKIYNNWYHVKVEQCQNDHITISYLDKPCPYPHSTQTIFQGSLYHSNYPLAVLGTAGNYTVSLDYYTTALSPLALAFKLNKSDIIKKLIATGCPREDDLLLDGNISNKIAYVSACIASKRMATDELNAFLIDTIRNHEDELSLYVIKNHFNKLSDIKQLLQIAFVQDRGDVIFQTLNQLKTLAPNELNTAFYDTPSDEKYKSSSVLSDRLTPLIETALAQSPFRMEAAKAAIEWYSAEDIYLPEPLLTKIMYRANNASRRDVLSLISQCNVNKGLILNHSFSYNKWSLLPQIFSDPEEKQYFIDAFHQHYRRLCDQQSLKLFRTTQHWKTKPDSIEEIIRYIQQRGKGAGIRSARALHKTLSDYRDTHYFLKQHMEHFKQQDRSRLYNYCRLSNWETRIHTLKQFTADVIDSNEVKKGLLLKAFTDGDSKAVHYLRTSNPNNYASLHEIATLTTLENIGLLAQVLTDEEQASFLQSISHTFNQQFRVNKSCLPFFRKPPVQLDNMFELTVRLNHDKSTQLQTVVFDTLSSLNSNPAMIVPTSPLPPSQMTPL